MHIKSGAMAYDLDKCGNARYALDEAADLQVEPAMTSACGWPS